MAVHALAFALVGRQIHIHCEDRYSHALIEATYGGMRSSREAIALQYTLAYCDHRSTFVVSVAGRPPIECRSDSEFLAVFEDQLALDLQRQRPELYFLHAAVLADRGKAFLLLAPSGGGKSTTTWALLQAGYQYLSDEFAPIDLATLTVHPYPRAICLKACPPQPYRLPEQTLVTAATLHVPTRALPTPPRLHPLPLAALFFLDFCPAQPPQIFPLTAAAASQRVFVQALNPLAHPADGLDGAISIVRHTPCFRLVSSDLPATCLQVQTALARLG